MRKNTTEKSNIDLSKVLKWIGIYEAFNAINLLSILYIYI